MTVAASERQNDGGGIAQGDFLAIIRKYNEVTERLRHSHDALGREVFRLREELQEKNKELQRRERLAALGEMAAGVAHEIRNPLGAIHLYTSLLQRDVADRPAQLELVNRIDAGVKNLESIVGDILAFAGDIESEPADVSLGALLDEVVAQTGPQAERRGVMLTVDDGLRGAVLHCDGGQIVRALVNLVVNAIEIAPPRGRVWLESDEGTGAGRETPERTCRIRVADDGPGIDPAYLQRVFHPFFTTKHTGTGLGLSIVHRIAEANGGWVRAENRRAGGAAFVLAVPLAEPPTDRPDEGRATLLKSGSAERAGV